MQYVGYGPSTHRDNEWDINVRRMPTKWILKQGLWDFVPVYT